MFFRMTCPLYRCTRPSRCSRSTGFEGRFQFGFAGIRNAGALRHRPALGLLAQHCRYDIDTLDQHKLTQSGASSWSVSVFKSSRRAMHTGGGQRGWATGARNTAKQLATALKFPGCIAWIVVIILMAMICIVLDVKG